MICFKIFAMNATNIAIEPFLKAIDAASSAETLVTAVENLSNLRSPLATPHLISALGYNNPGAAVASVDGLIAIGEPAVEPLLSLLDNHNYGARAWAIRALAGIGDPRGLEILLDTARNDFALSVRRAAARGLGTIQWNSLDLQEQIVGQARCLEVLWIAAEDPEWVVRYAAITGIQALGAILSKTQPLLLAQTLTQLEKRRTQDPTLAVVARIALAQHQLDAFL
jgi:phycocyanobilin lyase subunit beta